MTPCTSGRPAATLRANHLLAFAAAGDRDANRGLAALLGELNEVDELRRRAADGDEAARWELERP